MNVSEHAYVGGFYLDGGKIDTLYYSQFIFPGNEFVKSILNSRHARLDMQLILKSARHFYTKKTAWIIESWKLYVAEELRIRALMRKAYMHWSSLRKASAFNSWQTMTQYTIELRKKMARRIFMNCVALETWNSSIKFRR